MTLITHTFIHALYTHTYTCTFIHKTHARTKPQPRPDKHTHTHTHTHTRARARLPGGLYVRQLMKTCLMSLMASSALLYSLLAILSRTVPRSMGFLMMVR